MRLRGAAAILAIAVLASRVLGFLRDAYIAGRFGATGSTDAFYAAFTIPDLLNYLVAGGTLSITFIPIYARYLAKGDEAEGNRVFSLLATLMGVVVTLGVIALEFATPWLAERYLHKLSSDDRALAISLTRILLPAQLAFYLGGLSSATLFARQRFAAVAFAPLIYNLGTILGGILLGGALGVHSLAWGTLAGAIVGPFAIQAIAARKAGVRYRPALGRHPDVTSWLKLSLPLMIGVSLVTADEWITRYFAAADTGVISCLSYARKLVLVPIAVAGQAVGQASLPFFARLAAEGKRKELAELIQKSARSSAVLSLVLAFGLAALAVPTVELLFHHGKFAAADVGPTALYTMVFALAIPLWAMQAILSRAYYATGDTLTPMIAGTVITIVAVPIYALLYRSFGAVGLVIASDVGILAHTLVLSSLLPKRLPEFERAPLFLALTRAAALASVSAVPAYFAARAFVTLGAVGQLLLGGIVYAIFALVLCQPLGVPEVLSLVTRVRARFRPTRVNDSERGPH